MSARRWRRVDQDLVVTPRGVSAICPNCGGSVVLCSEDGVDECSCGHLLRLTVESRGPWIPRGGTPAPFDEGSDYD